MSASAPEPSTPEATSDLTTTAGKLADLEHRRHEAILAGKAKRVEKQHAKGKMTARERLRHFLDADSFVEMDDLARHRSYNFGGQKNRPYGDGVVTGTGTIDGRPVCVFAQDFTVFGGSLGEVFGEKIIKVMDLALKNGWPDHRDQRLRRRAHPGGRGLAGHLRRDLPPQRPRLRGHPADLADHGPLRRRRGLLPGHHRLHRDGRQDLAHVHHRPGRHQDRHRRGRRVRGARRRAHAQHQVRRRALHGRGRARRPGLRPGAAELPAGQQPRAAAGLRRGGRPDAHRDRPGPRHPDPGLPEPALRHAPGHRGRARRRGVPRGPAAVRAEHGRRLRPGRGALGRDRGQPADAVRRHPGHRRLGEGRAVRAHLRRVQHPGDHLRRRPRLPARHRPRSGTASSAAAPS